MKLKHNEIKLSSLFLRIFVTRVKFQNKFEEKKNGIKNFWKIKYTIYTLQHKNLAIVCDFKLR